MFLLKIILSSCSSSFHLIILPLYFFVLTLTSAKLIVAKFYTGTGYQRDSSMFYLGASYQRDSSIFYLGASYQRDSSIFYLGASYQRDSSIFYLGANYQRDSSMFYLGANYQRDSSIFYLGASYQRDSSIFYLGANYQRNFNSAAIPCRNHQKRLSPVTGAAFPAPGRAPISCQSLQLALTGSNMKLCGSS